MDNQERLQLIRQRMVADPSGAPSADDLEFLLNLVDEKERRVLWLEKKNSVLSNQVAELTLEMENVRSDFGGQR